MAVSGDLPHLSVDPAGSLFAPPDYGGRLRYVAHSILSEERAEAPDDLRPYLALPPLGERVLALAKEATRGARGDYEKAKALEDYLSKNYGYTLKLGRFRGQDPVEGFLFDFKEGNCEYFATSMALMLRAIGIPSRLVTGFVRGEWNQFGRYFVVRKEDAHAWVEAYIPGRGWVSFDPTPRPPYIERAPYPFLVAFLQYLDFLKMRWNRFIIDYSAADQIKALSEMRRRSFRLKADFNRYLMHLSKLGLPKVVTRTVPLILLAAFLIVGARLLKRRGRPAVAPIRPEVRFYRDFLHLLARYGRAKPAGMTPYEFAKQLNREGIGEAEWLTLTYYSVRYGLVTLTPQDQQMVKGALKRLRKKLKIHPSPS